MSDDFIYGPTEEQQRAWAVKHTIAKASDTPMRERLARAACVEGEGLPHPYWHKYLPIVDAILREMLEPSEATLKAGDEALPPRHDDESLAIWQAMIQHIIDEAGDG